VRVRQRDGRLDAEAVPVRFTRVAPGGSLLLEPVNTTFTRMQC